MPRPASAPPSEPDLGAGEELSVDWTETAPTPGDDALEARIAELQAHEQAAAADLAAALSAEDGAVGTEDDRSDGPPLEPGARSDLFSRLAAARAEQKAALERLLAARVLTGTALAHRPHIALVDQLSGTLLALTDAVELRQAATTGRGLGPPPATEAYEPTGPLARFVKLRDRRCRFPGCRARARCADLDHQIPHPHGPTAHDNLACLCEFHHRLSHQAPGWRLHRDEHGGLVWTLPGGYTVTSSPPAVGIDDAPDAVARPAPADRAARRRRTNRTLEALRNWRPHTPAPDPGIPF